MKCTICGHITVHPAKPHAQVVEVMQTRVNEDVLEQSGVDPCDWQCCELCWYGIVYNSTEYIWDGVNLLVYDREEEEYIEPGGDVWKPVAPVAIQFEKPEGGQKWMSMARRG